MRFDCIERRLAALFGRYAGFIVKHPWPFILMPIILTAGLSVGLIRNPGAFIKDDLDLYTPTDAPARRELKEIDHLFHVNDTDPFYAQRRYDVRRTGYIIVTGKPEGADILNPAVMHAAMQLWTVIQSLTIEEAGIGGDGRRVNYPSMCVKWQVPKDVAQSLASATNSTKPPNQVCVSNPLVEAFKYLLLSRAPTDQNAVATLNATIDDVTVARLAYPVTADGVYIAHLLGGITLDDARRVVGAKAIMLPYALRHTTPEEEKQAELWELKLAKFLLGYNSPTIRISWWTYETLASESSRDREQLINMMAPMFITVTMFTVACCCVGSAVRSRPWLAIGGVLSAGMAIVSGVGLLLMLGFRFTSVAYSMPFIIFSIGVDNVFILLSAWRKTPVRLSLPDRMSLAWSEAGVSITVTSLTDGISFGVGCMTTFPSVQIFCVYAVVAVIFAYLYQLTFFAGIMAITSRREVSGRHCLTFRRVAEPSAQQRSRRKQADKPKVKSKKDPSATTYWSVTGGNRHNRGASVVGQYKQHHASSMLDPCDESFSSNHWLARFFRTTYADILLNPLARIFIILMFIVYLGVAAWGCTQIKLGLEPNDLLPDDSYARRTMEMHEKYFTEYGSNLHVWMHNLSDLDTGQRRLWVALEREIELYEHTEFTGYSDSWLRTFMAFVNTAGLLVTPDNFVYLLKNVFLKQPQYAKYLRDIRFDEPGLRLEAVRFPVHLRYVGSSNQSRAMHLFRRLAETSDLPTGVYADFFQFAEQYNAVLPGTLFSIGIAGGAVILVSLLLIPKPSAALWVSLSIVSINLGILGFMTFWSVKLDFISMVTLVMSIGFCVDFSAHLAYNFAKGTSLDSSARVRNALYAVGTPILQSAFSTLLGVAFLASVESYVFRSFLKTVILVIVLGAVHGLVILPVLLTLLFCSCHTNHTGDTSGETTSSSDVYVSQRPSPAGASDSNSKHRDRSSSSTKHDHGHNGTAHVARRPSISGSVVSGYAPAALPLAVGFGAGHGHPQAISAGGPLATSASAILRPSNGDWPSSVSTSNGHVIVHSGSQLSIAKAASVHSAPSGDHSHNPFVYHNPSMVR